MDLSSYALSLLRSGDLTLYRGTGKGVASVLLVSAENGSLVYLNRLEREYALRGELDAAWAARPIALTRYNGRPTLVLEDPGGEPLDRLLGEPLDVSEFLRITIPLAGALRRVHERGLFIRTSSQQISWWPAAAPGSRASALRPVCLASVKTLKRRR
jgi:hypothetical protein